MEKVYAAQLVTPVDETGLEFLKTAIYEIKAAQETLPEADYKKYCKHVHDAIRHLFQLPNHIFSLCGNEDMTKLGIYIFEREANGETYEVNRDENGKPYILVNQE